MAFAIALEEKLMLIPAKVLIHQSINVPKRPVPLYVNTKLGATKGNRNKSARMRKVESEPAEARKGEKGLTVRCSLEKKRRWLDIKDAAEFTFENSFRHQPASTLGWIDDQGCLASFLIRQPSQQRLRDRFPARHVASYVA